MFVYSTPLAETKLTDNSFEGTKILTSNMLNNDDYSLIIKYLHNNNMSSKYVFKINKTIIH